MLSDEEKEAIEILKLYFGDNPTLNITKYVNIVLNLIEKQQKEIEELKEVKWYYEISRVPKDKIKAKIEELEIEQESNREDLKIAIDNLLFQNIDKIGNRISINMSVREILQSLLEKE